MADNQPGIGTFRRVPNSKMRTMLLSNSAGLVARYHQPGRSTGALEHTGYPMRKRIVAGLAALTAGLVIALGGPATAVAQKDKAKGKETRVADKGGPTPKFLYGHDLKVRPGGKRDFSDAVRIGFEVYQDETTKSTVA